LRLRPQAKFYYYNAIIREMLLLALVLLDKAISMEIVRPSLSNDKVKKKIDIVLELSDL